MAMRVAVIVTPVQIAFQSDTEHVPEPLDHSPQKSIVVRATGAKY